MENVGAGELGCLESVSGCNLNTPFYAPQIPHLSFLALVSMGCDFLDEGPGLVPHDVPGRWRVLTAR